MLLIQGESFLQLQRDVGHIFLDFFLRRCSARSNQERKKSGKSSTRKMATTGVSEEAAPAASTGKGPEEADAEGKAPVHNASNAAQKAAPEAVQSQSKADLEKVAQTLREDASEGEIYAI